MSIPESGGQIQILLDRVALIDLKYQAAKQKNKFNIFNLLSRRYDEVNLHSLFIYELLRPDGSHSCGKIFLTKFLDHLQISDFDLESVVVLKEHRKIDLLIRNNKQAIIIENKLLAGDRTKQLETYHNVLKREGYEIIKIVYLSLDGRDCEDYSIGELTLLSNWKSLYVPISYEYDINKWIENCIKEAYDRPTLRETLVQYKSLVNEITGNTMGHEEKDEMVDLISKGENIFSAKKIIENWKHVRYYAEWYFWVDLEKVIETQYQILDLQKYDSDKLDNVVHGSRNRGRLPWYGLMFKIGTYLGEDVCIFIERGFEDLYYGLTIVKDNSKIYSNQPQFDKLALQIKEISDWPRTEKWLGGNYCNPKINFELFSNDKTLGLINPELRRIYINDLWTQILRFVGQIKSIIESPIGLA